MSQRRDTNSVDFFFSLKTFNMLYRKSAKAVLHLRQRLRNRHFFYLISISMEIHQVLTIFGELLNDNSVYDSTLLINFKIISLKKIFHLFKCENDQTKQFISMPQNCSHCFIL